ncbi:MAG: KH domain-containing protein [Eubacteriales bacterium]|nr:KH domain-containing protein [Eubacteriales bacterium]
MKELITFIAKSLVSQPEEVSVQETESSDGIIMELSVASDDMGKVIGKQGRIAKAIRTVVKASVNRGDKPVFVEIVD